MFLIIAIAFWLLAAMGLGIGVVMLRSDKNHRQVIGQLAFAVGQNLPLAAALRLAAESEIGRTQRRLIRIVQCLETGLPVGEALRRGHPTCPGEIVSTVLAAEAAGTLPTALYELHARLRRVEPTRGQPMSMAWVYAVIIGLAIVLTLLFSGTFMLPKFVEIFRDFGVPRPVLLGDLATSGPWNGSAPRTVGGWLMWGGLTVIAWAALVLVLGYAASLRPRRADRPGALTQLGDVVKWNLPIARRAAQARALEAELPIMDLALAAGWPFATAVDFAADVDANNVWRGRLREWSLRMRRGEDVVESAKQCGLPDLLVAGLRSGVREGDLRPGLRYCQEYYESLVRHWRLLLQSVMLPLVTVGLGLMVGTFVVSVMQGLQTLLEAVCRQVG